MTPVYKFSFDIFDTTLVRKWAKPIDLFWELGNQLKEAQLINVSAEHWQWLRVTAENTIRTNSSTGEVSIYQLYDLLVPRFNWSPTQLDQVIQYEIELERASLYPVPEIREKILSLHAQNQPVAFLSDMYLPSEVIQTFLNDQNLWAKNDVLYVSSDIKANKESGDLYKYFMSKHQLKPNEIFHLGDNICTDVETPRRLGIQAKQFVCTHLTRYEKLISENEQLPIKFRSLIAGASRYTRLSCSETNKQRQVIWNTAADVIAPVIFGFVYWVLKEAKHKGINQLYFVARDGQILFKIAQIINKNWNFGIECKYLYASRQALHFPAIQEINESTLAWLLNKHDFMSVRTVFERVNLNPENFLESLQEVGLTSEKWDDNLTKIQINDLKQFFQRSDVEALVVRLAEVYRKKAIGYFKQEGIDKNISFALVDTGWSGKSQKSFSKLLKAENLYPTTGVYGFYFGLERQVTTFDSDQLQPYFLNFENLDERCLLSNSHILELFLAADHGSTTRYEYSKDSFIPILRSDKNNQGIDWGIEVQQEAIIVFARYLTDYLTPSDISYDAFYMITEDILQTFIYTPDKFESQVFGAQPFSKDQEEGYFLELAPAYNLFEGLKICINQKYVHSFVWLPASIQRSNFLARLPLYVLQQISFGYTYALLNEKALEAGDHLRGLEYAYKAIKALPLIIFSRKFITRNLTYFANQIKWLKSIINRMLFYRQSSKDSFL